MKLCLRQWGRGTISTLIYLQMNNAHRHKLIQQHRYLIIEAFNASEVGFIKSQTALTLCSHRNPWAGLRTFPCNLRVDQGTPRDVEEVMISL